MAFLEGTLLHPVVLEHSLKWSYQVAFLKQCVSLLEKCASEIRDEFYEHLLMLQDKETNWPQKWVYRNYLLPACVVTVKEAPQIISEGTTGLSCWQAGIFLADWMSQNAERFDGKRLLELGSGTGATGLIVSKLCGPRELVLSDCHENVLRLLHENVELNRCEGVRVMDLNWEDASALEEHSIDPDVVLAADVVYDDSIFKPLINVLGNLWNRNRSLDMFLAATVRNEETLAAFLNMATESGLQCVEVCSSRQVKNTLNWDDRTEIKLFLIKGAV